VVALGDPAQAQVKPRAPGQPRSAPKPPPKPREVFNNAFAGLASIKSQLKPK
jgi:hypothetical protein